MSSSEETIELLPPSSSPSSPLRSWRRTCSFIHHDPHEDGGQQGGKHSNRKLNALSLGFIAYFAVASGPFGIEVAVQAAGSFPVLVAVMILPFTWGMPQALMTAELSTMMDENGGYILWVRRGLGQFAGWMNAFNAIASNLCDLPTYPVLFLSYVEAFLMGQGYVMTSLEKWAVKGSALFFVFVANVFGMRAVAFTSTAMSIFVLAPFVVEFFAIEKVNFSTWGEVAEEIDWSLFLSTILWNYQGWDSLGCIAGEVRNGGRTFPLAIMFAMVLITINYAVPVAVGISVFPDYSIWKEGMLETVALKLSNWIGVWVALAAMVATLGEFMVVMACSSRAVWATASYRMLPAVLSYEVERFNTPVVAIMFQSVVTAFLMSFSFGQLVILDTFFNNLTLLLEFFAYIRLKYIEPDTKRPFVVPFGKAGAWFITIPKIIVLLAVLIAQGSEVWFYAGVFNVLLMVAYVVWSQFHEHTMYSPALSPHSRSSSKV